MFFMFWGGTVFMAGWILRAISAHNVENIGLFISQLVLTFAGPPIYAAAEYKAVGRLMHYLPMHTPLHPGRVFIVFVYLGAAVEALTGAGAGRLAAKPDSSTFRTGLILISVSLLLQAVVECMFLALVGLIHYRCVRARQLPPNVRTVCLMLYGTSSLILIRCIFRAVASFTAINCGLSACDNATTREWYLYAFEAVPMVLYTYWLNIMHPGRFLPVEHKRYLDPDGRTERMGPGWIDERSRWRTYVDPFDVKSAIHGRDEHTKFWLRPEEWSACDNGSFALGTARNHRRRHFGRLSRKTDEAHSEKGSGRFGMDDTLYSCGNNGGSDGVA